jgi:hypothetical protein
MAAEQGERIAVLEARFEMLERQLDAANGKLDQLLIAFNMGRGGWIAAVKICGLLCLCIAAGAWLLDHARTWLSGP